jgi:hypothetical protein
MGRKRAMTTEQAREVRRKGHEDARLFAEKLGIGKEFQSDPTAKKDIIDSEGHSYSVKSGQKKWQIFLYGKTRFKEDYVFQGMNGVAQILLECINSFPENREEYLEDKSRYKERLSQNMEKLKEKLSERRLLKSFLDKSLFNSGEVNFFVIKENEIFHLFSSRDVVDSLSEVYEVENSTARRKGEMESQKVVFKVNGITNGEIEMRNDSDVHYREIKFWLDKKKTLNILKEKIKEGKKYNDFIVVYGKARGIFFKRGKRSRRSIMSS